MRSFFSRLPKVLGVGGLAFSCFVASGQAAPTEGEADALAQEITALDAMFPAFTATTWIEKEIPLRAFVYGDSKGIVHLLIDDAGKLREKWRSFPLEGAAREVFAADLDRDGQIEIVAYTTKARVYVWETDSFKVIWESVSEKFTTIQSALVADIDQDNPLEIILCADNKLVIYDGEAFSRDKEGRDTIDPAVMLLADVDGDLSDEIVTNDGYVIDATSLSIEWATDGFGFPMTLFDIDNDGVFEIVGEAGSSLRIWDAEDRREIW